MKGVYRILNMLDGKCYVGSTYDLKAREKVHFSCLRRNCHSVIKLQRAVNKHGLTNFKFEILEVVESKDELMFQENKWIGELNSIHFGYNINWAAPLPDDITRFKISNSESGKVVSDETRKKISATMKGKPKSEQHRKNLSKAGYGRKISQDQVTKMIEGRKQWIKENRNEGPKAAKNCP
jgi:group I intron endonuclease